VEVVQPLLRPYPSEAMGAYPVSTLVNNARNDDPQGVLPLA
jgi:putative SOS response-associated peptidase YedK